MLEVVGGVIEFVPDVIWSGLLASVITLSGVWVSNRSNNQRLSVQLKHDSVEKEKERIYALRSVVYLSVVEVIDVTLIHLSSLISRDVSKLDVSSEMQIVAGAMAKLKLVAEPETSKLANELGIAMGAVFMKIMPCLLSLQQVKMEIDTNSDLRDKAVENAEEIKIKINAYVKGVEGDEAGIQALHLARGLKLDQSVEFADATVEAHRKYSVAFQDFNNTLLAEMKPLTSVQSRLMIATRTDLGLVSNAQEIQRQLELQWTVMGAAYGEVMEKINN